MAVRSAEEQQYWAACYAVEFLVGLIAGHRIAAAEAGRSDDYAHGVEKIIADALAFVPSVRSLRKWMAIEERGGPTNSDERVEMGKAERTLCALHSTVGASPSQPLTSESLGDIAAAKARSIWGAIPKAWRDKYEVAEYAGMEKSLTGLLALPFPIADRDANESWQAERWKLDQELGELLDQKHLLEEQAIAALLGKSEVAQQQRDDFKRLKVAITEKRAGLEKLDGTPAFANVTEVRRALSERTAGELADRQRAQREIETLTQQLATTGGSAGQRRLREKIAALNERLLRMQPGPWKKFGSKAAVLRLAKRAGLTKTRKSRRTKGNS